MRSFAFALLALCASQIFIGSAQAQKAVAIVGPVEVVAHIDVQPDQMKLARSAIQAYRQSVRSDANCLGAVALQERGRPSRFVVLERWKDDPSYRASLQGSARTKLEQAVAPLTRAPIDRREQTDFLFKQGAAADRSSVFVLTHVDVTPPQRAQTEGLLTKLVLASRSDPGVESFDVFRQAGQANHFTLFEVWNGVGAFDAHGRAPAAIAFRRSIAPLLGALYDERIYDLINAP